MQRAYPCIRILIALAAALLGVGHAHALQLQYRFTGTVTVSENSELRFGDIQVGDLIIGTIYVDDTYLIHHPELAEYPGMFAFSVGLYIPRTGHGFRTNPWLTFHHPDIEPFYSRPQVFPETFEVGGEIGENETVFYWGNSFSCWDEEGVVILVEGETHGAARLVPDTGESLMLLLMGLLGTRSIQKMWAVRRSHARELPGLAVPAE